MPADPSRRAIVCGGCALIAACASRDPVWLNLDDEDSGDTAVPTDDPTAGDPTYPCGQDLPAGGGRIALALADYPALASVGGSVAINTGRGAIIVAHGIEGCYTAILRACAHEGVPIDYRSDRRQFVCPRHGAIYALDGRKVSGPQPTGLPVFPAAREGDTIWVDVS